MDTVKMPHIARVNLAHILYNRTLLPVPSYREMHDMKHVNCFPNLDEGIAIQITTESNVTYMPDAALLSVWPRIKLVIRWLITNIAAMDCIIYMHVTSMVE